MRAPRSASVVLVASRADVFVVLALDEPTGTVAKISHCFGELPDWLDQNNTLSHHLGGVLSRDILAVEALGASCARLPLLFPWASLGSASEMNAKTGVER